MKQEVELGDIVECKYSKFKGTAVAKTEFINGCVQWIITPVFNPKEPVEDMSIDEQSLIVIKKKPTPKVEEPTGGPNRKSVRQRGY